MGVIQDSINQVINTAAVGVGGAKKLQSDAKAAEGAKETAKAAEETAKNTALANVQAAEERADAADVDLSRARMNKDAADNEYLKGEGKAQLQEKRLGHSLERESTLKSVDMGSAARKLDKFDKAHKDQSLK